MFRTFFNKRVRVVCSDDEVLIGTVVTYTPAIDSDLNEDEIGLRCSKGLIGLTQSEIKSIDLC